MDKTPPFCISCRFLPCFPEEHVRFPGCAVPKLDFSHIAAWTSMGGFSVPVVCVKSAAFFFGLAVSVFLLGGMGGL